MYNNGHIFIIFKSGNSGSLGSYYGKISVRPLDFYVQLTKKNNSKKKSRLQLFTSSEIKCELRPQAKTIKMYIYI